MSHTAKRFGRLLRHMRLSRGLSQLQLAERASLSENAISAFERAERFPRATTIDSLTKALNTDVDALLGEVLSLREQFGNAPEPNSALRRLANLLKDRPEDQVELALDVCARILTALPKGPAPLVN